MYPALIPFSAMATPLQLVKWGEENPLKQPKLEGRYQNTASSNLETILHQVSIQTQKRITYYPKKADYPLQ